jgi:hypothetical protein
MLDNNDNNADGDESVHIFALASNKVHHHISSA